MTAMVNKIGTLHNLLDYDGCKFFLSEMQLKQRLPGWVKESGSMNLKTVLQQYIAFVEEHILKISNFFNEDKVSSLSVTSRIIQAYIEELDEKIFQCSDIEVKDACLLAGIQAINHFKISSYGTAAAFSNALGMPRAASLFHDLELNEKEIDQRLSELAEKEINIRAKLPIALP